MADRFTGYGDSPSSPARRADLVTPNDSTILDPLPKAIIAGTAGNIALKAVDSAAAVTIPVYAGQQLDIRAEKVLATGTTATNIVALS
jgi:hypothetical protein